MSGDKDNSSSKILPAKLNELFPTYANFELGEAELNNLTLVKQSKLLHNLDYRQKYQLLRKSDQMVRLLRQMPAEDLYFTIEAAGRTDAMDLVLATSPEQMQHIVDMTCWQHDDFLANEFLDWFGLMIQVDMEQAMGKLRTFDTSQIALMLSKFIKVHRYEWSDEQKAAKQDKLMTFDDMFYFEIFESDEINFERLTVFLKTFYRLNFKLYQEVMEGMIWELTSNVEEFNFRTQQNRMADHGYPAYLDAISLFANFDAKAFKNSLKDLPEGELKDEKHIDITDHKQSDTKQEDFQLPVFFGHILSLDIFFSRVIEKVSEPDKITLRGELVYLGNRILIARRCLTNLDIIKNTLDETQRTLSLGLEYLVDSDLDKAVAVIGKLRLVDVFRVGYSVGQKLGRRAKEFSQMHLEPLGTSATKLISSPSREVLTGLLREPPQYFAGASKGSTDMTTRTFTSLKELDRAYMLLDRIEFLFDLHFKVLAIKPAAVFSDNVNIGLDPIDPDMRLIKIFMTAFANAELGLEADYKPLSSDDFERLLLMWLEKSDTEGYQTIEGFIKRVNDWVIGHIQNKSENYRYLAGEWAYQSVVVLRHLISKLKGLSRAEAIELSQMLLLG